jgi:hypothetical protein
MKTRAGLIEKIPVGPAYSNYRDSLQVSEVTVGSEGDVFAIRSNPTAVGSTELDAPNTLIYVRGKARMSKPDPAVQILEQYNPWTLDTLPFTPKTTVATIVSKKVAENTVSKIRKSRRKDRYKWAPALTNAGIRVGPLGKIKTPKTVPDMGYAAFQLEFGLGVKPAPHWRPTLKDLITTAPKKMARSPKIKMLFTNPSFTGWKRWEKIQGASKIRPSEARKFVPFQRKLGIRP